MKKVEDIEKNLPSIDKINEIEELHDSAIKLGDSMEEINKRINI